VIADSFDHAVVAEEPHKDRTVVLRAVDLLARMEGHFVPEKVEHSGSVAMPFGLKGPEDVEARIAELARKASRPPK
jgi:hypothetical protein